MYFPFETQNKSVSMDNGKCKNKNKRIKKQA